MFRQVDCRRPCELPLFSGIDGSDGIDERAATSKTHFDKYQGVAVEHDQVDLAVTTLVVARDQFESGALEFPVGEFFGFVAAQSSSGSSHGSESVASASPGGSNSPCSLMS